MDYRVVVVAAGKGRFDYSVSGQPVGGRSERPLLDACRALKRMGADPAAIVGLFHGEARDWALRTTVGGGAGLTVVDLARGGGVRFGKFRGFGVDA